MKKLLLIILLMAGLGASAFAQEKYITEERNVGTFIGVKASMGIDVKIIQAKKHSVTVESDNEYIIGRTDTYVKNGILHVKYDVKLTGNNSFDGYLTIYVYAPEYKELTATMGSDLEIEGTLKADYLKITATMGASLSGKVNIRTLEVLSKMGADISLEGKADICIAKASGGSDLNIRDLKCKEVDAQASSGSGMKVYATGKLDARAGGGANIRYYGNPEIRNVRGSATGDVIRGE